MNIETAKRLFEYRKANGYSQEELAEKIGVSRQAISKWERSESSPDTDNLIALANLYGVTIDELLNGTEAPKKASDEQPAEEPAEESGETYTNNYNESEEKSEPEINFDNGFNVQDGKDKVHIGWDGIHVESKNGDKVHVNGSGVHVQNGGHIYYDSNQKPPKNPWLHALLPISAVILYLILGFSTHRGWAVGWILFLLIPVIESAVTAFNTKNPSHFAYPVFVTALYLTGGMCFGVWHPTWILFITIPMYYVICDTYRKTRKNNGTAYQNYNHPGGTYYSPDGNAYPVNNRSRGNTIAAIVISIICGITIISVVAICSVFGFLGTGMSWIGDLIPDVIENVIEIDDYENEHLYSIGSGEVPVNGITDISIDWISNDIHVEYYDGETISISEPEQSNPDYSLRYRVEANELKIKFFKSGLKSKTNNTKNKELTVRLPKSLNLSELDIEGVSANVNIEGINAREINIETVSGNLNATGNFVDIDRDSVSGNSNITTTNVPTKVDSDTVSGDFSITVPESISGFTAKTTTVSGSFNHKGFDNLTSVTTDKKGRNGVFTYGDGSTEMDFDSVSGDFRINAAA